MSDLPETPWAVAKWRIHVAKKLAELENRIKVLEAEKK